MRRASHSAPAIAWAAGCREKKKFARSLATNAALYRLMSQATPHGDLHLRSQKINPIAQSGAFRASFVLSAFTAQGFLGESLELCPGISRIYASHLAHRPVFLRVAFEAVQICL